MPQKQLAAAAVLALLASALHARDLRTACDSAPKVHTELVASGNHAYTVRMSGRIDGEMTRDPVGYWAFDQFWEPNLYVRLENTGEEPIVNPWLRHAARPDTRSVRSLVDSIVKPSMSEAEKARRLFEFEIKNRFHATTDDEEVDDVVKRFNCYGYTLCGNESVIMSELWRGAGLRVRQGFPNGHSTAEVFYDGAWHLLDSDESIVCLLRDNKTIASEAQIVADHDLMKRTHTYGPLHDDDRFRDESSAALHYWEGERSGEQPRRTKHSMNFVLRPREAITWAWNPGNRFHGKEFEGSRSNYWNKRWRLAAHVMNGELAYTPDFTAPADLKFVETRGLELRAGPFGRGLYLNGAEGALVLPVKSPYPVVGGRLEVDFNRADQGRESIKVAISFDAGKTWREIWTAFGSEYARMYIDLDEFFPAADPAHYEYLLRFSLASRAAQPVACIKGVHLRSTLQMARLALPGLSLGANPFTYTDESGPGRKARITHSWRECAEAEVPGPPPAAVYPQDGGTANSTQFTFRWQPPASGPEPADYEFQLSEYPDMRWVLSPNFHKLIARTANRGTASFELPYKGLLNPGEIYHWRVRARSGPGIWGPWSKIFSFQAASPAVPVNPTARFERESRKALLSWEPGAGGTRPARYRIYGSAERGFTTYDRPFVYHAGIDGRQDAPANLLLETRDARTSLEIPAAHWRAWYRVAAVDAEGRESGPSGQAELAHPVILTRTLPPATAAAFYQAAVAVSASIGHLVSADVDGKPYHMMFRAGDELEFELAGAPQGLSIGRKDGVIAGYLPAGSTGKHELSVKVSDRRTGTGDAVKLTLEVR